MHLEHLKIAVRSLFRNRLYSLINVLGLTLGLTVVMLIGLFLLDELTFDAFHSKAAQIYRVIEHRAQKETNPESLAAVSLKVSLDSEEKFPEIEQAVFLNSFGRVLLVNPEKQNSFYEELLMADRDFLKVFDFPLEKGNPDNALFEPASIILSHQLAQNLFGDEDPINKTLETDRGINFRVTGVLKPIPGNSHLQFTTLISAETLKQFDNWERISTTDWTSNFWITYLNLKAGTSPQSLSTKITAMVNGQRTSEEPKSEFELQALSDIHFYSNDFNNDRNAGKGNLSYSYIFALVGLFILFIASINYINLTTARGISYGKEVGVRKVVGASRKQLIQRFLSESLVLCLLSFLVALNAVYLLLPHFNTFASKDIRLDFGSNPLLLLFLLGLLLLVSFLAGAYPAFHLSRFHPIRVLKGKKVEQVGQLNLRKSLVVFQYVVSSVLIIGTLVAFLQLKYIQSKDLGFSESQLVVVDINSGRVRGGFETIKQGYLNLAAVKSVSVSSRVPGEWKVVPQINMQLPGINTEEAQEAYLMGVDEDFLSTFKIELIGGQNFVGDPNADSTSIIINETAAKLLGITALNDQAVQIPGVSFNGQESNLGQPFNAVVKGIVKDFHFQSLHEEIRPLVLAYRNNPMHGIDYFTARIDGNNAAETILRMTEVLQAVDPNHIFEYHFLDDQLALFYETDRQRSQLFSFAAGFAIFIACMGVFGLAAFTVQRRTKEVGVRKVLGATFSNLIFLLSKEFIWLVLWSLVIAIPMAWWATTSWLADFAYRIELTWWMFALPGALALMVTLLTVSSQAFKAARLNPVESLRCE